VGGTGTGVELPAAAGITGTVTAPTERAATAIRAALSWLGTPYAWGGGNSQGPTLGITAGCSQRCQRYQDWTITGFDCSGLTLYAWAQAGVALPHGSYDQVNQGHQLPYAQALPGDLLFWGGTQIHHVALYLGLINGRDYMVESPQSGDHVKVSVVRTGGDFNNIAVRL
jgi:cell wall-associated NlpC family hydrolase